MPNRKELIPGKGENILFEIKNHVKKVVAPHRFPLIKCAPGEKVLCVQRQHPLAIIAPMSLTLLIAASILVGIIIIPGLIAFPLVPYVSNPLLIFYFSLIVVSSLLIVETYLFTNWYYQFYIITNKALVHKHFFTMGGFYSEAVFLEEVHQQEISRHPPNIICDFLKIQNVYVNFRKLEREEPFIFKLPRNAQEIEDILQNLTIRYRDRQGPT